MKLSFVFLCLSLATLSLASIPSPAKDCRLSRKSHRKPSGKQVKNDSSASSAASKSSQAAKPVRSGKKVSKRRPKKGVGATKSVVKTSAGAGKKSPGVSGSGKSGQESSVAQGDLSEFALSFFPEVLVRLIGEYLEGFSVVFEQSWSSADAWSNVGVDNERHYLITKKSVQASSHGDGEQVNLGSPDLSNYSDFQSSQDGRSLLFTGKSQEQAASRPLRKTARWLVQDTSTKSFKSVTLEGSNISNVNSYFKLSANGKTLVSTFYNRVRSTWSTSVYQIEEHGKTSSASKKAEFNRYPCAVSGNGNRILVICDDK